MRAHAFQGLFAAALVALAGPAQAQGIAPPELIASEARIVELDGPEPGTPRALTIWRAPSTPGVILLPTLYVADGANGVYVAAARLRGAIESRLIPPVQIIGMDPDLRHRAVEYGEPGRSRYRAHERWVLETVIPWAERIARASPHQRAIAGYSNGGDLAIAMAAAHPDIFSGVVAASPVSTETLRLNSSAANIRWALSAGRIEMQARAALSVGVAGDAARAQGAAVRTCTGTWRHDPAAWIDLAPGAIAWVFAFPAATEVASPLEREACRVVERR